MYSLLIYLFISFLFVCLFIYFYLLERYGRSFEKVIKINTQWIAS